MWTLSLESKSGQRNHQIPFVSHVYQAKWMQTHFLHPKLVHLNLLNNWINPHWLTWTLQNFLISCCLIITSSRWIQKCKNSPIFKIITSSWWMQKCKNSSISKILTSSQLMQIFKNNSRSAPFPKYSPVLNWCKYKKTTAYQPHFHNTCQFSLDANM